MLDQCCPVHFKVHWLWALVLLQERAVIILDPLTAHTGKEGHKEICKKIWHWREAVLANYVAHSGLVGGREEVAGNRGTGAGRGREPDRT